jgi:hypothetical protein
MAPARTGERTPDTWTHASQRYISRHTQKLPTPCNARPRNDDRRKHSSSLCCHRYITRKIIVSLETSPSLGTSLCFCCLSEERLGLAVLLELRVVEVLLRHTTAEELGLGATDVDVLEEDLRGGVGRGHGLGLSDLGVDVGAGLLVEGLELLLGRDLPLEQLLLEAGDGILGAAHALDLLTCAVGGAGVGHGVTTVAVGDVLVDKRTLAGVAPFLTVLNGGFDGEGVHAVNLETRNVLTTLVVLGECGRAVGGGTHTVLVVW